ncbi:hypothetical protein [Nocardioides sp. GY 10127]|uniref:hypothetical protein n=1 Tax=Nocardioides sp. GY 10127 TaxID=2569762 RepID=UPI0010A85406|nr:hypothetical protein [Nocardioides sp. GY 10127]TIC81790.1 hypothetical protein E8D37_11455 [Nocardioides sp. GY 10127]
MSALSVPLLLVAGVLPFTDQQLDPVPETDDVTAGWMGVLVIVLLFVAFGVLAFSLSHRLRNARRAQEAGVYGDEPVAEEPAQESTEGTAPRQD